MNDAFQACTDCSKSWHVERTLDSWYLKFSTWVSVGQCSLVTQAVTPGQKIVIPYGQFYDCLAEWFMTDAGRNEKKNIVFNEDGKISAWRQYINPIDAKESIFIDGPQYLRDMDMLQKRFGLEDTFTMSGDMLLYEQFVVIVKESIILCSCSLVAIFLVTCLISGSLTVGILVFFSVALIDLFIFAMIPMWDLTYNNIVMIQVVISLGLSTIFSINISIAYLHAHTLNHMPKVQHRDWKTRVALGRISTSVLHGSLATLSAVVLVGIYAHNSYFFEVFFKLWLVIISFGTANSFLLIPTMLSMFGPLPNLAKL